MGFATLAQRGETAPHKTGGKLPPVGTRGTLTEASFAASVDFQRPMIGRQNLHSPSPTVVEVQPFFRFALGPRPCAAGLYFVGAPQTEFFTAFASDESKPGVHA